MPRVAAILILWPYTLDTSLVNYYNEMRLDRPANMAPKVMTVLQRSHCACYVEAAWRVEMRSARNVWEHLRTLVDIQLKGGQIKAEVN